MFVFMSWEVVITTWSCKYIIIIIIIIQFMKVEL